jgi:hypothetical protein
MLAYLIDQQATLCEQPTCDVAPVVPAPGDQELWAQVAYEAAQHLDGAWIPGRRRGSCTSPCAVRT